MAEFNIRKTNPMQNIDMYPKETATQIEKH